MLSKDGNTVDALNAAGCTTPHAVEFAGIWTAPDANCTDFIVDAQRIRAGCGGIVAAFAKLPNDPNLAYRVGMSALSQFPQRGVIRSRNSSSVCSSWTMRALVMFVEGIANVRL